MKQNQSKKKVLKKPRKLTTRMRPRNERKLKSTPTRSRAPSHSQRDFVLGPQETIPKTEPASRPRQGGKGNN